MESVKLKVESVVYAHCNCVNTDGIVLIHKDSHLYLSSASVSTGNENGLLHTGNGEAEATAKSSYVVEATLVLGTRDVFLH